MQASQKSLLETYMLLGYRVIESNFRSFYCIFSKCLVMSRAKADLEHIAKFQEECEM